MSNEFKQQGRRTPLEPDRLRSEVADCTGCGACGNICPRDSISFPPDDHGFFKPFINPDTCIGCGACLNVCPILHPEKRKRKHHVNKHYYCGWAKDSAVRVSSSSGGIFTPIAEYILRQGGCVFGVRMDGGDSPHVCMAETPEELVAFRGSKYLQAGVGDAYRQVKAELKKGRLVLYSGTSCQIGGLLAYLGKRPDNLLTIEIICHGVPSRIAFDKYLEDFTEKGREKRMPGSVSFRDKRNGWIYSHFGMSISWGDGSESYSQLGYDLFLAAFMSDKLLNKCCYSCRYVGLDNHLADFILGDAWMIWKYFPHWDIRDGVSAVITCSERAEQILRNISGEIVLKPVPKRLILRHNPALMHHKELPEDREQAFEVLKQQGIRAYLKAFPPQPPPNPWKWRLTHPFRWSLNIVIRVYEHFFLKG